MTDSYLYIFLDSALASQDVSAAFTLLFLFAARILPIIAQAPFFGSRVLPHPVKIALMFSLFAVFLPQLLQVTTTPLSFAPITIILFAKELFIGYLLGLFISIPFIVVQASGMYIDHQRGGASLMVNDPTIQNQSSPLGTIFNMILIYMFFMIDGPFLFLDSIMKSYEIIPPDKFINPQFFAQGSGFWDLEIGLLNKVVKVSVQLATPALLAILMTDVFLGIANRLAPQVQITFLGMPLKSLLGLAVLVIGWKTFTSQMVTETYGWLATIEKLILLFRPA